MSSEEEEGLIFGAVMFASSIRVMRVTGGGGGVFGSNLRLGASLRDQSVCQNGRLLSEKTESNECAIVGGW